MSKQRRSRGRNERTTKSSATTPHEPGWFNLLLSLVSLVLLSAAFPQTTADHPMVLWPAAFVGLVPWLVAVVGSSRRFTPLVMSYGLGVVFFAIGARWLWDVTPPGHIALALYLGAYFPLAAWLIRHLHRKRRVSLTWAVPVVWTATEFVRGTGVLAFPWLQLGQSPYRVLTLIQVADLGGVYAVTFVVAMVNGLLADLILVRRAARADGAAPAVARRRGGLSKRRVELAATGFLLAATVLYGRWRLGQETLTPGPRVTVVQGDYVLSVASLTAGQDVTPDAKRRTYFRHALEAAVRDEPDLIVFPETPWSMSLNPEYRRAGGLEGIDRFLQALSVECDAWLRALGGGPGLHDGPRLRGEDQVLAPLWEQLRQTGHTRSVVVGGFAVDLNPEAVYPEPKQRKYNSAYTYSPGQAEPARYDKSHLVLFGEYVPFRGGRLHGLYRWLNRLTPWGQDGTEYSLSAGDQFTAFRMESNRAGSPTRSYRFATPICFEDTIPYVCRNFVRGDEADPKRVDLLINISNDGWFGHSVELTQHLAVSVFRTVEHRVALVRAVNTGLSGFVDPTGKILKVLPIGTFGTLTATVPIDSRVTLYTRWGDWFAKGCAGLALVVLLDVLVSLGRGRRTARRRKPNS